MHKQQKLSEFYKAQEIDVTLLLKRMALAKQLQASADPEERAAGKLWEAVLREQAKGKV